MQRALSGLVGSAASKAGTTVCAHQLREYVGMWAALRRMRRWRNSVSLNRSVVQGTIASVDISKPQKLGVPMEARPH